MHLFNLTAKVAIVTGGYGHLGSALVRALLSANAQVIVAGRSKDKYDQKFTVDERSRLDFLPLDITSEQSVSSFFAEVLAKWGRVDILVNNAHTARGNSQEAIPDADWAYTMDGMVGSVHRCMKAVIPIMKEQQSGKIINISSMYGAVSPDFRLYLGDACEKYTNPPHYGVAKAAMNQLTRYFAVLLGPHGIYVNAIAPGPFPKPEIQAENPRFVERLCQKNPLNKVGKPDDLAGILLLLSSPASDFITGQIIQVDGGWTIW